MNILVISAGYPYEDSNKYVFVKQVVDKWMKNKNNINVISPVSITNVFKGVRLGTKKLKLIEGYYLYSPRYLTFSKYKIFKTFSQKLYTKSIFNVIKKNNIQIDVIYAHFFYYQAFLHLKYRKTKCSLCNIIWRK